jgi:raffinose/stachyose/melibiose transport system substrate-binding protein
VNRNWCLLVILSAILVFTAVNDVGAAGPVKITMWSIQRPNKTDVIGLWLMERIKAFEAANPGVKIKYNYTENEAYKTKLQVAMLGGAGPDIFFNWGGETQTIYSREGLLYDLTKALGKDYWGLAKGLFSNHSFNGKIYGIPMFPTVNTVWYNKILFKKYGLKSPVTWSEFLAVCKKLKSRGIIPMAIGGKEPWTILHPFMYMADRMAGAKLYNAAKAGKARFDHPAFVRAFSLMARLSRKGYLPVDVLNLTFNDASQLMIRGKAAMMSMGNWEYNILTNESKSDFNKWDFFTFPTIKGGKGDSRAVIGASDGYSLNQKCRHPAEAIKFLKFLASRESLTAVHQTANCLVSLATPYMARDARPQMKRIAALLANASSMTLWWDQDLPAPMTQALLQGLQEILGGVKSPRQVARALEKTRKRR